MAVTQSMAYDHPAYTAKLVIGGSSSAINAANTHTINRFAAFTDILVKSYTISPVTAGTSAALNIFLARRVRPGVSTLTQTIATLGTNAVGTNVAGTFTLAQGDILEVVNTGTDATGNFGVGVEMAIVPGANVTP